MRLGTPESDGIVGMRLPRSYRQEFRESKNRRKVTVGGRSRRRSSKVVPPHASVVK